jgi:glycosyltransferase involved in cell wall biosynthesis
VQTHTNVEAIVIDDGSSDDTQRVVEAIASKDSRVRYFHKENGGVASARNMGIHVAQGDYVAFLDSDDEWARWKLEVQIAAFRRWPEIGMVWTDMTAVGPDDSVVAKKYLRKMYAAYRWFPHEELFTESAPLNIEVDLFTGGTQSPSVYVGDISSQMITGNLVHTSTVLISRERLQKVGIFNERFRPLGEDFDFHLRTCREGLVGFIDVPSIKYQVGMPDQLTHRSHALSLSRAFLETIEPIITKERDQLKLPKSLVQSTLAYAYGWYGRELLLTGQQSNARSNLYRSLTCKWSPEAAVWLAISVLPDFGVKLLRQCAGSLHRAFRSFRQTSAA